MRVSAYLNRYSILPALFVCALFSPSAFADGGDLFPAKKGGWWIYKITDGKGKTSDIKYSVIDLKQQKNGDATFKIVSQNSKEQETKFCEKHASRTSLTRIEVKGKSPRKVDYTPAILIVDSQIKPGSVWQWNGTSNDPRKPSERWQVFPNEKVKVPAGEFNCVKIGGLMVDKTVMIYQMRWYAPNVGIVKAIDTHGPERTTEELKAFHLN